MPQLVSNRDCLIPGPTQVTLNRIMCANNAILQSLLNAMDSGTTMTCDPDAVLESCACVTGSATDLALANMKLICQLSVELSSLNVAFINASGLLFGSGSPEGVVAGRKGWHYLDTDVGADYAFLGTNGTMVGWV